MTADHRLEQMHQVRSVLSLLVAPVQYLVNLPVVAGEWLSEGMATRRGLQTENANLKAQQLLLKAQVQKLESLEAENRRLRRLLDSGGPALSERVLIAELLAVDSDAFTHQIVLNKGSRNGIYEGQPLLDAYGVMGQVIDVGPITSRAVLITDASHALPVQVNRNGVRALATGTGNINQLELIYVPDTADIRRGDLLVSSGLGGRFPAGYPVGVVTDVQRDPGQAYARVRATATAHLDRSREVLLAWPHPLQEGPPAPDVLAADVENGGEGGE